MSRGGPPWSMVELAGPPMDVDELSGPGMELDGAGNANADVSDDAGAAGGNDDGWDGAVCGGMRSACRLTQPRLWLCGHHEQQ